MGVLIGHASISENGTINGTAGDQTGREVCARAWYAGWDFMAIHPDAAVREKHAKAVEAGCANDNIGYSQYGSDNRNTLNTQAKAVGYDLSKIKTKCNTDCSAFQNVCAVASGSGATYGSNGWVTSNMKANLQAAGYKIITDPTYLASEEYCVRGAIYVKASKHTVAGLTNGSKAAQTLQKAGVSGGSDQKPNESYAGKGIGSAVAKTTMNVRSSSSTAGSVLGTVAKGKAVEVLEIISNAWYKIVWPGASCGYAYTSNVNGAYYSYTANKKEPEKAPEISQQDAESTIWNYLMGKIGNAFGVAGMMGNLKAESNLRPNNLQNTYENKLGLSDAEYTARVDDGRYTNFVHDSAGYGLAQWTYYTRKQGLLDYARAKKASIGDLQMQLEYLWQELQGYKTVLNTLKSAGSVKEASDCVLTQFERPANQDDTVKATRAGYGQEYYNKYAGGQKQPEKAPESSQKAVPAQSYDANLKGAYTTTSGLNLRAVPGVIDHKNVLAVMPQGAKVQNYGYYTSVNGVKWLYVVYNGNIIGYCSSKYLKK